MKAPPFAYVRASSLADVFKLWSEGGSDAKLLAGGQSLLAALAFRLSEPTRLIDISRVPELKGITETAGAIRIGALTTHATLGASSLVKTGAPLLAEAVHLIAHPAIRNRGTIGGSLAYADPAAELPACCVALDATIIARSTRGERAIPASAFFTGLYTTALEEGELIAAVEIPKVQTGERATIVEIARRSGDYAMAGLAAHVTMTNGVCRDPRLVFFALGEGPVRAKGAEAALGGNGIDAAALGKAVAALATDLDPPADMHGDAAMKRHLAGVLLKRALEQLGTGSEARAA